MGLSISVLLAQHEKVFAVDIVPSKVEMVKEYADEIQQKLDSRRVHRLHECKGETLYIRYIKNRGEAEYIAGHSLLSSNPGIPMRISPANRWMRFMRRLRRT